MFPYALRGEVERSPWRISSQTDKYRPGLHVKVNVCVCKRTRVDRMTIAFFGDAAVCRVCHIRLIYQTEQSQS